MDEAWLGDWAGSGKAAAKTALSAGGDQKTLNYELCKATISEKLEVEALIEVLKEADCAKLEDFPSVRTQSPSSLPRSAPPHEKHMPNRADSVRCRQTLSDVFWLLHLVCDAQEGAKKEILADVVKESLLAKWVSGDLLKARCEPELLELHLKGLLWCVESTQQRVDSTSPSSLTRA